MLPQDLFSLKDDLIFDILFSVIISAGMLGFSFPLILSASQETELNLRLKDVCSSSSRGCIIPLCS